MIELNFQIVDQFQKWLVWILEEPIEKFVNMLTDFCFKTLSLF